jgi:hypothetical protein
MSVRRAVRYENTTPSRDGHKRLKRLRNQRTNVNSPLNSVKSTLFHSNGRYSGPTHGEPCWGPQDEIPSDNCILLDWNDMHSQAFQSQHYLSPETLTGGHESPAPSTSYRTKKYKRPRAEGSVSTRELGCSIQFCPWLSQRRQRVEPTEDEQSK